jgi:regulator of sigma E protease
MISFIFSNIKVLLLIAASIFSIGVLVAIHEFGHFFFAKLFGVRTPSFSIGMGGPIMWSKKIGDTEFKINSIPFGGYLEIAGLAEVGQGKQQEAHAIDSGSFQIKPYWQKILIMSGGVLFNLLAGFIVFIGLFCFGMPKTPFYGAETARPIISKTVDGSIAQKINLQENDEILSINQSATPNILSLLKELQQNSNKPISLRVKRADQELNLATELDKTGRLGIDFKAEYFPRYGFFGSITQAWKATAHITHDVYSTIVAIFTKRALNKISSPLLIISYFVTNASQGLALILCFLAFISISLFLFNLIPLPITDGGQIILVTIESIIGRQIPEKTREIIYLTTWGLILILTAYLVVKDSIMLFWPKIKTLLKL